MLKVYKQKTYEGCFPSSLLILGQNPTTFENELDIINKSLTKRRDNYYACNILSAYTEKFKVRANLFVEDKAYSKYLNYYKDSDFISIETRKINLQFLLKQSSPFILQIDDFILGDIVHALHFIVVESVNKKIAVINDPWHGKRSKIKTEILLNAVESLKKTFLYSPLLINLSKNE